MSRRTKARKRAWQKELQHRRILAEYMNSKRARLLSLIDTVDPTPEQRRQMIENLGQPIAVNHLGDFIDIVNG